MKGPRSYAEDRVQCHTLTRRAHSAEQSGAPQKMHERIRLRAHLSFCQSKIHVGENHQGATPYGVAQTWLGSHLGASRGGVAAKALDHLPYIQIAGTGLH